jgi:hypothetical protein
VSPPRHPQHAAALEFARRELERGVREEPPRSNTGPRIRWYQRHTWLAGTRWPWCVAFFLTAWAEGAGRKLPYPTAGAYDLAKWARAHGWVSDAKHATPGDGVVFKIGTGHIGLLEHVNLAAGNVTTIDGNVSDRVGRHTRPLSTVHTFVHVPETPKSAPDPKPPAKPVYEVVTSASGHAKVVYVSGSKAVSRKLGAILNRYGGVTIRRRKKTGGR